VMRAVPAALLKLVRDGDKLGVEHSTSMEIRWQASTGRALALVESKGAEGALRHLLKANVGRYMVCPPGRPA
jgi:hypothetical protein